MYVKTFYEMETVGKFISLCLIVIVYCPFVYSQSKVWDVFSFGAKGDGINLDTQSIQAAIDDCYRQGGGEVLLANGRFLSGTIVLKSNVTLHLETGCTLIGSNSYCDYPVRISAIPSTSGEFLTDRAMIYAENAENIAIVGDGIINGRGDELYRPVYEGVRPHIIHLRACKDIAIRDVKLVNAATWVQKYQLCDNLFIEGIAVDSRENKDIELPRFIHNPGRNTDGCDIVDCTNVHIANCHIVSGDDGIVFKSFSNNAGCQNVAVTNCILSTNASGIKIGTESAGTFKDFVINNCVVFDTRGAGVGLMTVDGASMERILVSNVTMRNIKGAAIFVRLGNRNRVYLKGDTASVGKVNNVLFQNIYGTEIERYGCSITGIPDAFVGAVSFQNIRLSFKGGNDPLFFEGYENKVVARLRMDEVPEKEGEYPRSEMFGMLPAYGMYVRHVEMIDLNNVVFSFDKEETRSALVLDDVFRATVDGFYAEGSSGMPSLIYLKDVRQAMVCNWGVLDEVPVFVSVFGHQTEKIKLGSNNGKNIGEMVRTEVPALWKRIVEDGTF